MEAIIHRARKGGTEVPAQMRLKHPGRAKVPEDLLQSIRKLARLRAATPALRRGALTGLLVEDDAYAFARVTDGSRVVVVFNGAGASAELHVPLEASGIPNGSRLERICWGPHRRWRHAEALWRSSCRPTPPRSIGERPQVTEPAVSSRGSVQSP